MLARAALLAAAAAYRYWSKNICGGSLSLIREFGMPDVPHPVQFIGCRRSEGKSAVFGVRAIQVRRQSIKDLKLKDLKLKDLKLKLGQIARSNLNADPRL
jgi:hypothetical protein